MGENWSDAEQVVVVLGLGAGPTDSAAVKRALLDRLKHLQESHPGNTHVLAGPLISALEFIDPDSSDLELITASTTVAERSHPLPVPVVESEVAKPTTSTREAVSDSIDPARRTFKYQTFGLGVLAAVFGTLWALPNQLANHPFLPDSFRTQDGGLKWWVGLIWIVGLVAIGSVWFWLWSKERRFERLVRRVHDPDVQLDAIYWGIEDGGTRQYLYPDEFEVALLAAATGRRDSFGPDLKSLSYPKDEKVRNQA